MQPSDWLEIIGAVNRLQELMSKDIIIVRKADGTVREGDLVSARPDPGAAGLANTRAGALGIALNSALHGEYFRILIFGTHELRIQLDNLTDDPDVGWVLYARRVDISGFRWTYGISEGLPTGTVFIGQVVDKGFKVGNLWTGVCDVRIGPGLSITGQINTGSCLWNGLPPVRVLQQGSDTNTDLPASQWISQDLILPDAIPVENVTHLGGDIYFTTRNSATDFTGIDTWNKWNWNLDGTGSVNILVDNAKRWISNLKPDTETQPVRTTAVSNSNQYSGSSDNNYNITGWNSSQQTLNIANTGGTQNFRWALIADEDMNAIRFVINRLYGPAVPWAFGIHELWVLCRGSASRAEGKQSGV